MRYAEFMVEARRQRFYHGSRKELEIGLKLSPQSEGYVHGVYGDEFDQGIRATERVLEKYRPPHLISRLKAVFVTGSPFTIDHAGGGTQFIYEVKPIGRYEESCLWWYQELEDYLLYGKRLPARLAQSFALNYWNNVPPPEGKPATYEFRCEQAEIIRLVWPKRRRRY